MLNVKHKYVYFYTTYSTPAPSPQKKERIKNTFILHLVHLMLAITQNDHYSFKNPFFIKTIHICHDNIYKCLTNIHLMFI